MASIYLRPTADNYVNHTLYPEGSANGYTLIDEVTSDGASTYIGVTCGTANFRVTKTSSFKFAGAGVSMPLEEFQITGVSLEWRSSLDTSSIAYTSAYISFAVTSNNIASVSDPVPVSGGLLVTPTRSTTSFNRNNQFTEMFQKYVTANGKFPDVDVVMTTHVTSTKSSQSFYITQLYLKIDYDVPIYKKQPTYTYGYVDGVFTITPITTIEWKPIYGLYEKIGGTWTPITSPVTKMRGRFGQKGHIQVAIAGKAATCTSTGISTGYKCSCHDIIFKEQEVIAAKGHTPETVEASEATCGRDGYSGGQRCSVCDAIISGSIISATGNHTIVDVAATEPTCGAVGYTAGTQCSTCKTYLSGHEIIPRTDVHTPVDVAATEPTCGAEGYTAGTQCSVCNKYLSGHEIIPITGNHTPESAADGVAATDVDMGLTSRTICSVCGSVLTGHPTIPIGGAHTCEPFTVIGTPATCTSTGLTDGQQCVLCGKTLVAQQVIPVVQHTYITNEEGYHICSVCGYVKEFGITPNTFSASKLCSSRDGLSATTANGYAIFGCGYGSSYLGTASGDAYDTSLTKSTVIMPCTGYRDAATSVGSHAIFAGGMGKTLGTEIVSNYARAYNSSLTRQDLSDLNNQVYILAATTVGNYALFGGGCYGNVWRSDVNAYNTSLTKSSQAALSTARCGLAATTIGGYALFGGGINNGTVSNIVDAYNTSLTKGTASALSVARSDLAATSVGNYAIFAGGYSGSNINTTDAYNSSLTKVSIGSLSAARSKLAATTVGNYALFGGGEGTNYVDMYDNNLTKLVTIKLSSTRQLLGATAINDYALFGGGSSSNIVDVFTIK